MCIHSIQTPEFMEEIPIFLKKSEFVLLNLDATIKSNVFLDECTLASFPESWTFF